MATSSSLCDQVHPGHPLARSKAILELFATSWSDCFSMYKACLALVTGAAEHLLR